MQVGWTEGLNQEIKETYLNANFQIDLNMAVVAHLALI